MKVLFSRSHIIGASLIRFLTWSSFSHVCIIDGIDVISAEIGGVKKYPLAKRIAASTEWKICEIDLPDEAKAMAFARATIGQGYDYTALIGIFFRRDWQAQGKWFCSEHVATACVIGGREIVRKEKTRVTPQDVWQSPLFKDLYA